MAVQSSNGWRVEVTGLREVIDALNEVDKRAVRIITKRITDAGKSVVSSAQSLAPSENPVSNWGTWFDSGSGRDLSYGPSTVRSSYKLRRNNYRRRGVSAGIGWDVYQTNPGGAIFELLGKGSTPFVERVAARFPGKQPRVLIPAYRAGMPSDLSEQVTQEILDEARKAGLV